MYQRLGPSEIWAKLLFIVYFTRLPLGISVTTLQSSSYICVTTNICVIYFGAYGYRYISTKVEVRINSVAYVLEIYRRSILVYDMYIVHRYIPRQFLETIFPVYIQICIYGSKHRHVV